MATQNGEDESHLLEIFSNEVWCLILENVTEVQDYHNLCSASPYFRSRLLPQAPHILFPEVIKILIESDPNEDEDLQWIVTRKVCHAWKLGFDQLQQTQEYWSQDDTKNLGHMTGVEYDERPVVVGYPRFALPRHFTEFETFFDPTHHVATNYVNPFVRRKVELCIKSSETYFQSCLQFLRKYGPHIWICVLSVKIVLPDNLLDFYNRKLSAILEGMPNLRALQIQSDDVSTPPTPALFPSLPHLEYVCVDGSPLPVVKDLLERNPQVTQVNAMCSAVMAHVFLECAPNLRALAFSPWDDEVHAITNARLTSQVERLWLNLFFLEGVTTDQVFHELHRQFGKSLEELHLRLPVREFLGAGSNLVLPRLKILHLEMGLPQRLDFLLPLKGTLEELHMALDYEPDYKWNFRFEFSTPAPGSIVGGSEDGGRSKIQVYMFWKELRKSNIWSFFPKLRVLEVKVFKRGGALPEEYGCTRREWLGEN